MELKWRRPPCLIRLAGWKICGGCRRAELPRLARELRDATISAVSKTGGHLGAGLGVVELTLALHYVFQTPDDRLIWDVGHQAYPHKILTGRRDRIETLRQKDGLSGFTKRDESVLILSVRAIPPPRSRQVSEWRWPVIYGTVNAM